MRGYFPCMYVSGCTCTYMSVHTAVRDFLQCISSGGFHLGLGDRASHWPRHHHAGYSSCSGGLGDRPAIASQSLKLQACLHWFICLFVCLLNMGSGNQTQVLLPVHCAASTTEISQPENISSHKAKYSDVK